MASASSILKKTLPDPPKTPSTSERLDRLEYLIKQLIQQGNTNVTDAQNHNRLIEALIELQGAGEVSKKMVEIQQRKLEVEANDQEAVYTKAVEDGHLTPVDASSKTDIILCVQQKNVEGFVLFPTRVFGPPTAFPVEIHKAIGFEDGKLTGELKVGQVIEMGPPPATPDAPSRGTLTVLAIYEPVVKAAAETPAEESPALPTDQAEQV